MKVDVNNAPCCPTPNALRPKNITAAVEVTVVMRWLSTRVMSSLSYVAVVMDCFILNVLLTITVTHLLYICSKAYDVFLVVDRVFH